MQQSFWNARWETNRLGFHRTEPTAGLLEFAHILPAPPATILVPMCGKATDLTWLAERGHRVLGVEFVRSACQAYFEENGFSYDVEERGAFQVFSSKDVPVEIYCGDVFDLSSETLAGVGGVYDRAGLVALEPSTRTRYLDLMADGLPAAAAYLLIALERTQDPEKGPPFSLPVSELRPLFQARFELDPLQSPEDQDPDERGFVEVAYSIRIRG